MPKFLLKKWQAGEDPWGDSFRWQEEEWLIEAPSLEIMNRFIDFIGGAAIYANESLCLHLLGECEASQDDQRIRSMLGILQGHFWGVGSGLSREQHKEFYDRGNRDVNSGIRYALECRAPELIPHIFTNA